MNNGKVRIYDLSKDLNLENKDILVICEGLNIPVKSHSSTISETDAERIRAAAEKYSPRPVPSKRSPNGDRPKPGSPNPSANGRPHPEHKQQILQIKHRTDASNNPQATDSPVATPPQAPVKPQAASPMKPTTVSRPARVRSDRARDDFSSEGDPSEFNHLQKPEVSVPASMEEQPKLVQPPQRGTANAPGPQASLTVRPVLKRDQDRNKERVEQPAEAGERTATPSRPVREKKSASPERSSRPQAPGVPDLQRPERKVRISEPPRRPDIAAKKAVEADGQKGDDRGGSIETLELELRRPTPPRQVKRGKTRNQEEEEELEALNKAGKVAPKGKRRTPIVIDDDDDDELDGALHDLSGALMVSKSVARPAKPKSAPGQSTAPAASAPSLGGARPKRSRSDSNRSDNRDRNREQKVAKETPENLVLSGNLSVRELADALAVAETEIIKQLFFKGIAVNITQTLDIPTATMVAEEFGVTVETAEEQAPATKVTEMIDAADLESLQHRPPVVTIMGHVDHGKTTLLDAIRETKVAQGEAGGITQHIGAYHVDVDHNGATQQVVFLDTPGHEAFTAMRARGARVTDIAILVVAADDGVRPQTIEAIRHAQAAEVPIVVAVNKIDKPEAQPDRVKQELTEFGLVPEEWGGQTIMVDVSALKGENLDTLLEMILLVAEIEELSANPDRSAKGTIIEAHLDKAKGPVASLLVQNGTLRVGDTLVAGHVLGKVRAMVDDRGARVEAASPSFAVEVLGLSDVPAAGDEFLVFANEKEARATAEQRSDQQRQNRLQQVMASRRVTLNTLSAQAQEGELKELNLILKADVQGSVEAILGSLKQLPQKEVQVRVLLAAAGEVTETDVDLAAASGAVIIGFNTTLASGARGAADTAGVDVREYNIIYKLLDDIQGAMEGLLEPEQVEEPLGQVEVRAVFPVGRGAVAGCYVLSGKAIRNCQVRVHRGGKVVHQGGLDSLKRMKDDVKEVNSGYECGIRLDNFSDWQMSDIIETFQMVSKRRTLSQ